MHSSPPTSRVSRESLRAVLGSAGPADVAGAAGIFLETPEVSELEIALLRLVVRSWGRHHRRKRRCTSMCTHQSNTTAAIPGKFQEEVKSLLKWGNNQAKKKSEMPVVTGNEYPYIDTHTRQETRGVEK